METTTETNQNNRELTATEVKITLAQIEDRLTRLVKAMEYERSLCEGGFSLEERFNEENDPTGDAYRKYIKDKVDEYNKKMEIPYGVSLMEGCGMISSDIPKFMKFAKWWVKGEMTEEIFELFIYHYSEIIEVDYFWVLMEAPGEWYGMYDESLKSDPNFVLLEPELKRIGTRSKKKAKMKFKLHYGHD
jgi:hypothetical protein